MSKEKACEITSDDAKGKVEATQDLRPQDRDITTQVLDELHRAMDNAPERLTGQPVCLNEKQVLGTLAVRGVSEHGLKTLDDALVQEKVSRIKKGDLKLVVYDMKGEHADAVGKVAKAAAPGLTDENILYPTASVAEKTTPRYLMPYNLLGLSPKEQRELSDQIGRGQRVAKDLNGMLQMVKDNPGVVINISMSMYDLALKGIGANEDKSKSANLRFSDLDMAGVKSLDKLDDKVAWTLGEYLEARSGTDIRAQTATQVLDALKSLADAGAQIRIAWGNEDKVTAAELVSQLHPNIKSVAALDTKGRLADYNSLTGHLAKDKRPGTVLFMPADKMDQIDKSKFAGKLSMVETPPELLEGNFSGEKLADSRMKREDFQHLKKMQPVAEKVFSALELTVKASVGHDLLDEESAKKFYKMMNELSPENTGKFLGKEGEFLQRLEDLGKTRTTQLSDQELAEHLEKNKQVLADVWGAVYGSLGKDLEKLGYKKEGTLTTEDLLQDFVKDWTDKAGSGVLDKRQMIELFGKENMKEFLARGEGGSVMYKLKAPILSMPPDGYALVKDKQGVSRLAQEWVGTSFASPVSAAAAIQAQRKH